MGDPRGFITTPRETPKRRGVLVRIKDWNEVYEEFPEESLTKQAGRCMDCGIPFCHNGCPLGNLIPEWNDLVMRGEWQDAAERLHATNNFPEFTGRLCPAPCETACVVGISGDPVTIKNVEVSIIDRAWAEGFVTPSVPERLSGKTVGVIGSGPAGLAAAQQLARAGHTVAVYERADRIGGLLRYGIPEFKMEKRHIDQRLAQMESEGVKFRTNVNVGIDVTVEELRARHDAIVIAVGATAWRDLDVPGRDLDGIYQAMEYLPGANRVQLGDFEQAPIDVAGQHVIVIGGGDTGADCLGTAIRQGAASITQLEIMPMPPEARPDSAPWPTYPMVYRVSSAHEEGGTREYAVSTQRFIGEGKVEAIELVTVEFKDGKFEPVPGSERILPADAVFLAMGFVGPEQSALISQFEVNLDARGNIARDNNYMTNQDGVFVAGDAGRGQSLIVWAIAEGRSAAAGVDRYLMGETNLPIAIPPTARPVIA
ncbi:MAG: glutamate synthase subunit beta [Actinomycetales bacterium]|nr:glutamate synthase subunit beta [Actinomycetales bacterium]